MEDREHIWQLNATDTAKLREFLARPNGSWQSADRNVQVDACGGGVLVRTQPYRARRSAFLTWHPAGTESLLDEMADLMAGYQAVIGPNADGRFGWTIVGPDSEDVTNDTADDASAAKAAVEQWFAQSVDYSTGRTATPPDGWER